MLAKVAPQYLILKHNSPEYWETVALRTEILRKPLGLTYTAEQLQAENNDYHLACYIESQLVGCLILTPASSSEVKMRQVAVSAKHQGLGIGKALVCYSEQFAQDHGFREMTMHARETAVSFYEKLGYEKVGEPFIEVTIPHFEMRKVLFLPATYEGFKKVKIAPE